MGAPSLRLHRNSFASIVTALLFQTSPSDPKELRLALLPSPSADPANAWPATLASDNTYSSKIRSVPTARTTLRFLLKKNLKLTTQRRTCNLTTLWSLFLTKLSSRSCSAIQSSINAPRSSKKPLQKLSRCGRRTSLLWRKLLTSYRQWGCPI